MTCERGIEIVDDPRDVMQPDERLPVRIAVRRASFVT